MQSKGVTLIMASKIKDERLDYLFSAILTLDSIEDCYSFFETSAPFRSFWKCHAVCKPHVCCAQTLFTLTLPLKQA